MELIITIHPEADANHIRGQLQDMGLWIQNFQSGSAGQAFLSHAHSTQADLEAVRAIDGIVDVLSPSSSIPLLESLQGSPCTVNELSIGPGHAPVLMAGPCTVESEGLVDEIASIVASSGGRFLRGGAFKPRTSPYSFAGHGEQALTWLRNAADRYGLKVVTEVMSEQVVDRVCAMADLVQIGSRNMQNFALLRAVGSRNANVLLKRGRAGTVHEWLSSAEHLLHAGAAGVILCERGIQSADPNTRNLLDLGAVALISHVHKIPVVADPSHALGRRDLIVPMSRAALAAGAHGLLLEIHPSPQKALSDGAQALDMDTFQKMARELFASTETNHG